MHTHKPNAHCKLMYAYVCLHACVPIYHLSLSFYLPIYVYHLSLFPNILKHTMYCPKSLGVILSFSNFKSINATNFHKKFKILVT